MSAQTEARNEARAETMAGNASGASNRTRLTRCLVIIERDATCKPSSDVYWHEIPILESLWGRGMVTVIKKWDKMVEDFDIDAEWERLCKRYNKEDKEVVAGTYRNGVRQLAKVAHVEVRVRLPGERDKIKFLSTVVDNGDPNGEILPVLERDEPVKVRKPKKAAKDAAGQINQPSSLGDQTGF